MINWLKSLYSFKLKVYEMKPLYKHDCDLCKHLKSTKKFDFYFCEKSAIPTYIQRFGNDGHEYFSFPPFVLKNMRNDIIFSTHYHDLLVVFKEHNVNNPHYKEH